MTPLFYGTPAVPNSQTIIEIPSRGTSGPVGTVNRVAFRKSYYTNLKENRTQAFFSDASSLILDYVRGQLITKMEGRNYVVCPQYPLSRVARSDKKAAFQKVPLEYSGSRSRVDNSVGASVIGAGVMGFPVCKEGLMDMGGYQMPPTTLTTTNTTSTHIRWRLPPHTYEGFAKIY
ncbi:hypothetical protein JTE90_001494 [Oedothorax gibbosus]|uniref:Uncharacterized protein n=1 Tax=Oedothorax gibbosus TaxID=931172 RepID=A0AAV6UKX2_9ARAC|nr:hypothetical protein JTE90_001494 [Oedothorax gibbosus]